MFDKWFFIIFICFLVNFSYCSLYFEISERERCFIEYIYANASLMLKWNVYPQNKNLLNSDKFNQSIQYIVFDIKKSDTKKVLFHYKINERKSKISFLFHDYGEVYICTHYDKSYHKPFRGVEMNLKIRSEQTFFQLNQNMIKKSEIENTTKTIEKVNDNIKKINLEFEKEKKKERRVTYEIINNIETYKTLTYIQIGLSIIIGLVYLYYFKRYIKSLNLI